MIGNKPTDIPEEFYELSQDEQDTLISWIKTHITARKTINRRYSSYGLKHYFEADKKHGGFYVTNGMFKGAMAECGFIPEYESDTNSMYGISNRSVFVTEFVWR